MDKEKIGKYIRELRESKKITQVQLAKKMYMSRSNLSDIENGKTELSFDKAQKLSEIFEVPLQDLLAGDKVGKDKKGKSINYILKNIKSRYRRKITTVLLIVLLISTAYLLYYFFNTYNSAKIYKIMGESEHFYTNDGIFVVSKEDMYFSLSIFPKKTEKIEYITLRYKDDKKDELIQQLDCNYFYIADFYNYNEYFDYKNVIDEKGMYYVVVKYDDGEENIELSLIKEYENKGLIFTKIDPISYDTDNAPMEEKNVPDKILKDFKFEDNAYHYKEQTKDCNLTIGYVPDAKLLIVEEGYDDYYNSWMYYLYDGELHFSKSSYSLVRLEKDRILSKDDELYSYFIDKYYKKYFD